jgi:hypothetical protein
MTRDEIVAELEKVFAGWPDQEVAIPKVPEVTQAPVASFNYAYKDINQAYLMIGHLGLNANDPRPLRGQRHELHPGRRQFHFLDHRAGPQRRAIRRRMALALFFLLCFLLLIPL